MGKYFSITELSYSSKASREGISNNPPAFAITAMTTLISKVLDPIRERWGKPITVSSGYRSPQLNQRVGGSATSDHVKGRAADIVVGSPDDQKELFKLIRKMHYEGAIEFDQLIEYPYKGYTLVHISYREGNNRNEVLSQVGAVQYNRLD